MIKTSRALAVSLLSGAFLLTATNGHGQTNASPPTTATRPTAPEQNSLPNTNAPPASTTTTTGQTSPDPKVKEMNAKEKGKIEREGK